MRNWFFSLLFLLLIANANADQASRLTILPAQTTLAGSLATQRLLVESIRDAEYLGDSSAKATYSSSNPRIATVDSSGIVRAISDGTVTITARIGKQKALAAIRVTGTHAPFAWSFRNHVLPVLTKAGCNAGACHGAAAGKGGLKLTLRGYDPDADFNVLTRQANARRVVPGDPAHSLLLLKPTMTLPHSGGQRIVPNSPDYAVLSTWIKAGTPRPTPQDARPEALEIFPALATLQIHSTQQILVRVRYSDGHSEDVTRWVKFGTSDNNVASVDDFGKVKMTGHGEAAITVWFSSKVAFARVLSPYSSPGGDLTPTPLLKEKGSKVTWGSLGGVGVGIDTLILKQLHRLNLPASPPCTDGEFLRRAYLDTAGILPTPAETTAFLSDTAQDKKIKLVDKLLTRPETTDYWTYKWSDLFLLSSRKLPAPALNAFYDFIHKSVETNKPWNQFAREILTARGSTLDNGAANYFVMHKDPIDLTETTTQAFLGMSLTCAHCHNHPMEKWTQRDYFQMANLFARVRLKNGDRAGEVFVMNAAEGNINFPRLGAPLPPRPLDGKEMPLEDPADRREGLADWLTAPENPYFAKAIVNRVWRSFMGKGLVEAEDDLRLTNPPSNQELLDLLAKDFVASGYDVRRLMRQILLSDAYQRSATPVGYNAQDTRYYSHYLVRRLPAEVILDSLSQVTGIPTEFPGTPKGTRALQLHDSQVASYFLTAFGRPEREKTCACERQQEPNVAQALHLSNGDTVNAKLRAPGGLIDTLLTENATDDTALNRLYLSALSRPPSATERNKALSILAEALPNANSTAVEQRAARRAVLEDLFWAVLTDREFLFNH